MRRLVHSLGDIFPPHLAVPFLVEEQEGVDELVEDVVELRRFELRNLTPNTIKQILVNGQEKSPGIGESSYLSCDVWAKEQVHEAEENDELLELDPLPVVYIAVAMNIVDLLL